MNLSSICLLSIIIYLRVVYFSHVHVFVKVGPSTYQRGVLKSFVLFWVQSLVIHEFVTNMYVDNQEATVISKNPVFVKRPSFSNMDIYYRLHKKISDI